MHELALVEEILRTCQEVALSHGMTRVTSVCVTVGRLAACPDALLFAWQACRGRFPPLEQAGLDIHEVPASWVCPRCGASFSEPLPRCQACGTVAPRLAGGLELRVDYLEGDGAQHPSQGGNDS